jgi:hypothetical protein
MPGIAKHSVQEGNMRRKKTWVHGSIEFCGHVVWVMHFAASWRARLELPHVVIETRQPKMCQADAERLLLDEIEELCERFKA